MAITPQKWEALRNRMASLDIHEADLIEKFILGSGPGGQKIQKSHSTVYLKHLPSSIEIKCQQARSRDLNRYYARQELCERIEAQRHAGASKKRQAEEKIRRQKQRRSRKAKAKMLEEKRQRSEKKKLRKPPGEEE